ncbi:MAG: hypothetical protein AAFN93_10565 [Bacteroidota bacterium]
MRLLDSQTLSRLTLTTILMLTWVSGWSQALTPDVIPPSPEAASLGKYLSTPVNYFSGLPQIQIPLYTVKNRDLSVDVSLSYHAGGIRVEEIASRQGLGWNLQAGGRITRSVRGIADDQLGGFLLNTNTVQQFREASSDVGQPNGKLSLMNRALSRTLDYEPDLFNFSYPGYSGQFVIDKNREVMLIPESDHKVTFTVAGSNGITAFTITDDQGYSYFFGNYAGQTAYDQTTFTFSYTDLVDGIPSNSSGPEVFYNSWHLLAIHSPSSDAKITFSYRQHETRSVQRSGQRKSFGYVGCDGNNGIQTSFLINQTRESVLSGINYTLGRIALEYDDTQRTDLQGDFALKKVRQYGIGGELLKTYELDHGYFISPDASSTQPPIIGYGKNHLTHRLYLKNVKEWNRLETDYIASCWVSNLF